MSAIAAILIGVFVGVLSGVVGIGGGAVLTPLLLYAYHMDQHRAQGTSLAMLLAPSGFLAFWKYYRAGNVGPDDLKLGLMIAVGVFLGGYFGGDLAQRLSSLALRRIFATFLILVALKMFWGK